MNNRKNKLKFLNCIYMLDKNGPYIRYTGKRDHMHQYCIVEIEVPK